MLLFGNIVHIFLIPTSGFFASGSGMCSVTSQSSGFLSSGSSTYSLSSQSSNYMQLLLIYEYFFTYHYSRIYLGFLCVGVLDLLRLEEVPVFFQVTRFSLFVVNQNFVFVVGRDDQGVQMGEFIILKEQKVKIEQNTG